MTTPDYVAIQLLNTARSSMNVQRADLVGTWPRTAALLGRQALEHALAQFWASRAPGVEKVSMRAQLLCLSSYLDPEVAQRARFAWHALSRACHHHAYELPPIESELSGWLDESEELVQLTTQMRAAKLAP